MHNNFQLQTPTGRFFSNVGASEFVVLHRNFENLRRVRIGQHESMHRRENEFGESSCGKASAFGFPRTVHTQLCE